MTRADIDGTALIHQLLSPPQNHHTDVYGGSFESRSRLLLQIVDAVHTVGPDSLPLFLCIAATHWIEGGWDLQQSVKLARQLKSHGPGLIDCSSRGHVPNALIPLGPGYQVQVAHAIWRDADVDTAVVLA